MFAQLIFGSVMLGVMGVVFWGFAGTAMAARMYYENQPGEPSTGNLKIGD
jgi:hypothetical protein